MHGDILDESETGESLMEGMERRRNKIEIGNKIGMYDNKYSIELK